MHYFVYQNRNKIIKAMNTENNLVTFYYCNSVLSLWKDASTWSYIGFPTLCGHIDGKKPCNKIFLKDSDELDRFDYLRVEAITKYKDEGNEYDWGCTLKLTLEPAEYNTYTIKTCEVHKGRFCAAK